MLLRALLVFLLVINLGVAAWWALRPTPPSPPAVGVPAGVPTLQLLSEAPRPKAAPRPAVVAADPVQCFSFGPFPNPALLRRAVARLQATGARARVRDVVQGKPSGWRVFLPPQDSAEASRALGERIGAAGFDDYLVLGNGPERNGIALGRFGSEAAARRHAADLAQAGFAAQVAPLGDVTRESWIDAGAGTGFDGARVAQDIDAARVEPLDCARLR